MTGEISANEALLSQRGSRLGPITSDLSGAFWEAYRDDIQIRYPVISVFRVTQSRWLSNFVLGLSLILVLFVSPAFFYVADLVRN